MSSTAVDVGNGDGGELESEDHADLLCGGGQASRQIEVDECARRGWRVALAAPDEPWADARGDDRVRANPATVTWSVGQHQRRLHPLERAARLHERLSH